MNKKGAIMLSVWFAIFIFIFGILFLNFIYPNVAQTRIDLDCTNVTGISDGNKMTCLATDLTVPYWILLVISVAGGVVLDRVLT